MALTPKQIKRKIENAEKRIVSLYAEIKSLQEQCPHPKEAISEKYDGDTGNWCPQDDSYWVDRKCNNCGQRWHIDSKQPGYHSVLR